MEEIIKALESSIEDNVLVTSERKQLKQLIANANFSKRELDFLRSKIFDIAKANQDKMSKDSLIHWLETSNKLTLSKDKPIHSPKVLFSPGETCRNKIIQSIRLALNSIKICVFTISDNYISREIIAAHEKGINVQIITDNDKVFDRGSDVELFAEKGLQIRVDHTSYHMHHKFCVLDDKKLITGSYNWTKSAADMNHENLVVLSDEIAVKSYLKEFNKLWNELAKFE